jgi:carboxyl-terminal processing protease
MKKLIVVASAIFILAVLLLGLVASLIGGSNAYWHGPLTQQDKLAIFDSFSGIIDKYYYDKTFRGVDWPRLKREGRLKVQGQPSQERIYNAVFLPITEKFPTSHLLITLPDENAGAHVVPSRVPHALGDSAESHYATTDDIGFQQALVRYPPWLIVGDVARDSPAFRAGIYPGLAITTDTISFDSRGVGHFSGKFKSADGRDLDIAFSFDKLVSHTPMQWSSVGDGVYIFRFNEFDKANTKAFKDLIEKYHPRGLAIDLRQNAGGRLDQLQNLLGAFLPAGALIGKKLTAKGVKDVHVSGGQPFYSGSVVTMIGPGSASAAEIFAEVMCEYHRGYNLGRRSMGAVMISKQFEIVDGGKLQTPVADYLSPQGVRIEGRGVAPDIDLLPSKDDVGAGHDIVAERAISLLRHGRASADHRCVMGR